MGNERVSKPSEAFYAAVDEMNDHFLVNVRVKGFSENKSLEKGLNAFEVLRGKFTPGPDCEIIAL